MCRPDHYRIESIDNQFMLGQTIDLGRAVRQWNALKRIYESFGDVVLVEPKAEFPDQVFTANPIIAGPPGSNIVVPAKMRFTGRRSETQLILDVLPDAEIRTAATDAVFEGGGDFLWTQNGDLIAAHGPRTDEEAIPAVAACFGVEPMKLLLVTKEFYHLDTCLALLDNNRALWIPRAFDVLSQERLKARFELIDVTEDALNFAGNAFCPDGKHVIIDAMCQKTMVKLIQEGFTPIPVDTSEFRKAGGSVYCMKHVL
jgi:N-dimethylarginine dimethylaminohydrolase